MSSSFKNYIHHDRHVWVRTELQGKHSEHCLCYAPCAKFIPNDPENNCPIANLVYAVCLIQGLVLPVWECPEFEAK